MTFKSTIVTLAFAISLLFQAGTAVACPRCVDSLPGPTNPTTAATTGADGTDGVEASEGADVARGFYWSILFMLAIPYSLVGGLGAFLYVRLRKRSTPLPGTVETPAAHGSAKAPFNPAPAT